MTLFFFSFGFSLEGPGHVSFWMLCWVWKPKKKGKRGRPICSSLILFPRDDTFVMFSIDNTPWITRLFWEIVILTSYVEIILFLCMKLDTTLPLCRDIGMPYNIPIRLCLVEYIWAWDVLHVFFLIKIMRLRVSMLKTHLLGGHVYSSTWVGSSWWFPCMDLSMCRIHFHFNMCGSCVLDLCKSAVYFCNMCDLVWADMVFQVHILA